MKTFFISIMLTFMAAQFAIADEDTVNLCVDMLQKKQANVVNKVTNKQAKTYCQCAVPQLEQLQKMKSPTQDQLNKIFTDCMNKAGIKQPSK